MQQAAAPLPSAQKLHVPPPPTPFIGRAAEVAELINLLVDPACRLLTLLGPGGIGKTRLALQTAGLMPHHFAGGAGLVPLQSIETLDFFISAIADTLNFPLAGQEGPRIQLVNHLRDKELLLVLDNFEQLLAKQSETLLSDILNAAPRIKFLVTSQEVLNLQEEWLYPIQGLTYPPPPGEPGAEEGPYSAIQLFVERALRVRRDFSLEDEYANVVRICQLVEGTPLALELAASWTKTLRCEVIAAEIQRNLDFLATNLRNVPERQRSMRAVFDHSWQLLGEDERNVFKRLSVFRSGFRREAAKQVAKATLAILTTLVDKSLLRWEPDGRYQMHEFLRQYAAEQLVLSPDDVAQVYDRHSAYYTDFLYQRREDLLGGNQREVMREITAELENIRAAWAWAVQQAHITDLQKATFSYYQFCDAQARFQEGAEALTKAVESLNKVEPSELRDITLASSLAYLGWHCIRLGRLEEAKIAFDKSQTILNELDIPPPPGFGTDPVTGLALLANILGNYPEALALAEEARRRNEAQVDHLNLLITFYVLTSVTFCQGQYEAARRYAQQAYTLANELNNRWFMAYILSELGDVDRALGDYDQARQQYQAGYAIKQEFNDPEGMAAALNHLGRIAWLQRDYPEAERLYRQGLTIYREISDPGGLATSLAGLGLTACATGNYRAARHYLGRALQITSDIQFTPLTLVILIGISELLRQTRQLDRGIELLTLVQHHPASDEETKSWARQYSEGYPIKNPPDLSQTEAAASLAARVTGLLAELASSIEVEPQTDKAAEEQRDRGAEDDLLPTPLPSRSPALIDSLTPRELEVLRLIAEGMTNQQIAEALIISVGTAKFYTSQIYSKLNVTSRTQAVARARELRLLSE